MKNWQVIESQEQNDLLRIYKSRTSSNFLIEANKS